MINLTDSATNEIRIAIVKQAAADLAEELRMQKKDPNRSPYYLEDIEKFFESEWFEWLTDCDGKYIVNEIKRMVRKEFENENKKQICNCS